MSNITVIDQALPDFLQTGGVSELTKSLMGNTGTRRIVPKNGIFRKEIGGKEMGKVKGDLNIVIVNSSPKVGRISMLSSGLLTLTLPLLIASPMMAKLQTPVLRIPSQHVATPVVRISKVQVKAIPNLAATHAELLFCLRMILAPRWKARCTK